MFNSIGEIELRSLRGEIERHAGKLGTPFAQALKDLILRAQMLTDAQTKPGIVRVPAWMFEEWGGLSACHFQNTKDVVDGFAKVIDRYLRWWRSPFRLRMLAAHTLSAREDDKPPAPVALPDHSTPGWPYRPVHYLGFGFVHPYFIERVEARDLLPYSIFFSHTDEEPLTLFPTKHWASATIDKVA